MNKCRDAFESFCEQFEIDQSMQNWSRWQAAWNARGKVDAEICRTVNLHHGNWLKHSDPRITCAEALKKENERD